MNLIPSRYLRNSKQIISYISNQIINILNNLKISLKKLIYIVLFVINKFNYRSLLLISKPLCFIIIVYHVTQLTIEYLHFKYDYTLNVIHNVGYYLPPISVCTENTVFYDKNLINNYFDISKQFLLFNRTVYYHEIIRHRKCILKHTSLQYLVRLYTFNQTKNLNVIMKKSNSLKFRWAQDLFGFPF